MSEIKQLSKLEILNETIQFYGEDISRRAVGKIKTVSCMYNTEDGRHCAVGRCLLPRYKEQGLEFKGNNGCSPINLPNKNNISSFDDMLEEQYQGHEVDFWVRLQNLHDTHDFWGVNGLTEQGEERLKEIKNVFGIIE